MRPSAGNFELFRNRGGLGAELVGLHALGKGDPRGLSFPVKGDNVIEEVRYQPPASASAAAGVSRLASKGKQSEPTHVGCYESSKGRVWINDRQYVEGVPESAWTFPIGGYLPAQRWLKDRIGRTLGFVEQEEYMRIIWALLETRRLMAEIDASIKQHGGWPLK